MQSISSAPSSRSFPEGATAGQLVTIAARQHPLEHAIVVDEPMHQRRRDMHRDQCVDSELPREMDGVRDLR